MPRHKETEQDKIRRFISQRRQLLNISGIAKLIGSTRENLYSFIKEDSNLGKRKRALLIIELRKVGFRGC